MQKKYLYIVVGLVIVAIVYFVFFNNSDVDTETKEIEVKVEKGKFEIKVTTTGELQAKNSEKIVGPSKLQRLYIYDVKITDLIPEGSLVDSGDYVATLDRSEVESKLKDVESELQKMESQFIKTQLDTTLELRNSRDELINLKYAMEEAQITLDQSKFETPATIRQNNISLEKSQRTYEQAVKNYKLKVEQAVAKMVEVSASKDNQKRKQDDLIKIQDEFIVNAPKSGMVIYMKEWGGAKRKVGSTISPWNNVVATLPDLSSMISKTYVNEIDISKVKVGQSVELGVDAFPEKKYTGNVTEVANVGEQLPNSEAKVFEVTITLNETDTTLRPSMTTSNIISVSTFDNVLFIPLEALHQNDSLKYVFKKDGFSTIKKVIQVGESNDNQIIVKQGLSYKDIILLSPFDKGESMEYVGLEFIKK